MEFLRCLRCNMIKWGNFMDFFTLNVLISQKFTFYVNSSRKLQKFAFFRLIHSSTLTFLFNNHYGVLFIDLIDFTAFIIVFTDHQTKEYLAILKRLDYGEIELAH
ncbi:hypothetical protein RF11_11139 [Thelohanellus kitauei]|uniref:Uncharacterized protein n=1 Tax=Thelohanellus kitauei TaxID=669202 RepID=A0A0C2J8T7_THEKT|nr:hypothetical protein RF11_11139 [Thelohanellus kitauei]